MSSYFNTDVMKEDSVKAAAIDGTKENHLENLILWLTVQVLVMVEEF